jgi:hypothetical protein
MNSPKETPELPLTGVEISKDLTLIVGRGGLQGYPTSKIEKGLVISLKGEDLCEEGVGFGVPVLKFGDDAAFPGSSKSSSWKKGDLAVVKVDYDINLMSRLALGDRLIKTDLLCRAKGRVDRLHRDRPSLRCSISLGSALFRRGLSVETRLVQTGSVGRAQVVYTISQEGLIDVLVRCWPKAEGCTEMAVMNEQGAESFDRYIDSEGMDLSGEEIGSWERTGADWGEFIDTGHGLSFRLWKTEGANLFRGREAIPGRLAWAGLAHVVSMPEGKDLEYKIEVGGSP